MLIQRYLNEGYLDTSTLQDADWTNRMLDLGFILGISEKLEIDPKILQSIYTNVRLNPSIRLTSILRSLDCLKKRLSSLNSEDKDSILSTIQSFDTLSTLIFNLKDSIGQLKEIISNTYTKTFNLILEKCALSLKLTQIGIQGHKNKELLQTPYTLLYLTIPELEKLDHLTETNYKETLPIIKKSCEHIKTNQLKPSDNLSILTFMIFFEILKTSNFTQVDLELVQEILESFQDNFSPKQKTRLSEVYKSICANLNTELNAKIVKDYEVNAKPRKTNENRERRTEEGELKLKVIKASEEKKEEVGGSVEELFEKLYYDIENEINGRKRVDVNIVSDRLKAIASVNENELSAELEYYSYNEMPHVNKSLLWRLISKAISLTNLFDHDFRTKLNKNIDRIVMKADRRGKY